MANILILGGGFGGVVAAEWLAMRLGDEHQITLVSRDRQFIFYPALVKLAFGKCEPSDVSFDLRKTMLRRRVNFVTAEVARINPDDRKVIIAHGQVEGALNYDYLIYALGRRLATAHIPGFYEHAQHVLDLEGALKFGEVLKKFHEGRAVIGQCAGSRLPVPVYETAFALSRMLEERGERSKARITIVSPDPPGLQFGDNNAALAIRTALETHGIDFMPDFSIQKLSFGTAFNDAGQSVKCDLLMLLPPFLGSSPALHIGVTNSEGYINVDAAMRVTGVTRMYAVGDAVNFSGPKLGHMAVQQAEVAAANVIAEIEGKQTIRTYDHEMKVVIDEGGSESIYVKRPLWTDEPSSVRQGGFWSWAKAAQEKYWLATHS
jgi:sulfide:quinone oxidoreductase